MEQMEVKTTFLKGCKESKMFCKTGLYVWHIFSNGTDERNDDEQVIAQLSVKMTEALSHLIDERIAQLTAQAQQHLPFML